MQQRLVSRHQLLSHMAHRLPSWSEDAPLSSTLDEPTPKLTLEARDVAAHGAQPKAKVARRRRHRAKLDDRKKRQDMSDRDVQVTPSKEPHFGP